MLSSRIVLLGRRSVPVDGVSTFAVDRHSIQVRRLYEHGLTERVLRRYDDIDGT